MANSSILGGERAARIPAGKDTDALGPSDSSDSGSDVQAVPPAGVAESAGGPLDGELRSDSDTSGTGERGAAVAADDAMAGADIAPDRVVSDPDAAADDGESDAYVERIVDGLASADADDLEDGEDADDVPAPDIARPVGPAKDR